jgi:putative ABC transport system substrate-binding protein
VFLATTKIDGSEIELWAVQIGARPGSEYLLLSRTPAEGLVESFARPGGNLTGLTTLSPDLIAKRLQLLKEAFPAVSHVVVLFQSSEDTNSMQAKGYQDAAERLPVRVTLIDLRSPADIGPAFSRGKALGADAYAIVGSFMINIQAGAIADSLIRAKVPSITSNAILVDSGVLMSYAVSVPRNFRRAAVYVDKILKGAKPGDLAIEQPTKFDLVINARTEKALGGKMSQSVLLRADRVIE